MAVTVKEFICPADADLGEPSPSNYANGYTFDDIPLTGEVLSVLYKNSTFIVAVRGDFNITVLNPGGSRTFWPVPPNGTPPALSTFIGASAYEFGGASVYWFQGGL